MKDKPLENQPLILSGNATKDFSSFLNSKEKPYDFGLELIKTYTKNLILYNFLLSLKENENTRKILIANIKIIAQRWSKK